MSEPKRRKFWGWGYEGDGLDLTEVQALGSALASLLNLTDLSVADPPRIGEIVLREPRLQPPDSMAAIFSTDKWDRAEHTLGKSFDDLVRGLHGRYEHPPDLVAFPRDEAGVGAVLEWCGDQNAAVIPYGGGSSVSGGVEPVVGEGYRGVVSLDLRRLDRVVEVDTTSRAARIQAGVLGPSLEEQLRPHGLTLRHFPQSFEMSSLGGWIATRSAGHYATLHTHIDEFVEGLRVLTPRGVLETRRLPGSGAGPSPDRLFCGSEGVLGVITEAWMRLQERPRYRASAAIEFTSFEDAVEACRVISQSGLHPANCRLLDQTEALISASGDGSAALLIVSFESADHSLDAWIARAIEICRTHSGKVPEGAQRTRIDETPAREDAGGHWRNWFVRGGHLHDATLRLGMVNDTFETAITWDRFAEFHAGVLDSTRRAMTEVCGQGLVSCRFAYVYPDGPAPYYTVMAPGKRGSERQQWAAIKEAASDSLIALGGTITHHHAVGRYHRRWYDRERPPLFADAMRAAKGALDPAGIMNPGVLFDPVQTLESPSLL